MINAKKLQPRKGIHSIIYNSSNSNSVFTDNVIRLDDMKFSPIKNNRLLDKNLPKKTRNWSKEVWKYFQNYCEGTSLHGLKYVGGERISGFERIFWAFSFLSAMGFAAFFISNIYDRWTFNPLIVGINPEFRNIFDIPFPAITICNMNQAMKGVAEKVMESDNDNEKWLLDDICDSNSSITNKTIIRKLRDWEFIKNFILKVSQPCTNLVVQCKWSGFETPCSDILNSALTDEGVCCTFNRVHSKYLYHNQYTIADFNITFPENNVDWTPEVGYPENATNNTWPYKSSGAGVHLGLTLLINVAAKEYYCSSTSSVGLKLRLHSPVETPMMADYGFFLHPRKEVRIAVRPTMDEASPSITNIPISQRQCFFSVEKQLFYYRTYTKMNCELECLSNYTLKMCSCVPFYLPKNRDTPICDQNREVCFRKAKTDMDVQLRSSIYCKCLPACNEISYAQDHSLGDISNPDLLKGIATEIDPSDLIILHVFYQTTQFRSYQKSEIFGFTEFLSNSGGLLGLFLGFSFLSAVEILYHLSLRLCCTYIRRQKEHNKKLIYPFTK